MYRMLLPILSMLMFAISFNLNARTYTLYGQEADAFFERFVLLYANQHADAVHRNIPLKGSSLQLFKSLLYVHCRKSVDPESINMLIRNYSLSKHAQSCKQLFIMMLSEIPEYDQHRMFKISVTVDHNRVIEHVTCQHVDTRLGTLSMGTTYFKNKTIILDMPGYVMKGGSR
jgi:hypothetical protein